MTKPKPTIKWDKKPDTLYITFSKRKVRRTERYSGWLLFPMICINYSLTGEIVGVEILW